MTRKLHRLLGLIMLVPLTGWAITGAFFFLKPGYAGAYEILQAKLYPLNRPIHVAVPPDWLECRYLKTVLGEHLLARTSQGWRHFDPETLAPKPEPAEADLRALIEEASAGNSRYGRIVHVQGLSIETDTGVRISVDWNRLSLQQKGKDTDRIDLLYRIHYLQWTGLPAIDRPLGLIGLILVLSLSAFGLRLFFAPRHLR